MNLMKSLMRMSRGAAKEKAAPPQHEQSHETDAPQHEMETPYQANFMQLQSIVGNRGVQRLIAEGQVQPQTGALTANAIQRDPQDDPTAVADAPAGEQTAEATTDGDIPMIGEETIVMFSGSPEFHAKAQRLNQYYANHPPMDGWPFTPELRTLWEGGQYDAFADKVGTMQSSMNLPDNQIDGALGPMTSRRIAAPASTPTQQTQQTQTGATPDAPQSSTSSTPTTTTAPSTTTTPQTPSSAPTAQTPAPITKATQQPADDPAIKNHPAALRILNPLIQAFTTYHATEKTYINANSAWENTKDKDKTKADKATVRNTALVELETQRTTARNAMITARAAVAALNVGEFKGGEAEMKSVREYINRTLNDNTIYYTQMVNANILPGNGWNANWRTCNMTVMSMMLEALGKTPNDYNGGDLSGVKGVMSQFSGELGKNNSAPDDVSKLRMPDFMQLVAIDLEGSAEKAAQKIVVHSFIVKVAKKFGLHTTEVKNGKIQDRPAEDDWFLSTKYQKSLDTIGALYRPAATDARKELAKDDEFKALKGDEKKAYEKKFKDDFAEKRRLEYVERVAAWIDADTKTKEQMVALQAVLDAMPPSSDPKKPTPFDVDTQTKVDGVISKLDEVGKALPDTQKGKKKDIEALVGKIQKARMADAKKPEKGPKLLKAMFDGKGKDDPIKGLDGNLKKYVDLKKIYDTLGEAGGAEKLVPVEDYKASVIPTMVTAISNGNQVMVNLENHFVRLQSVAEDGFTIDDPGRTDGENNKISWEDGRKNGYFKNYLLLSP